MDFGKKLAIWGHFSQNKWISHFHMGYTIKIQEKNCSIFFWPQNCHICMDFQKVGQFWYWQSLANWNSSSDFKKPAIRGDFRRVLQKKHGRFFVFLRKSLKIAQNRLKSHQMRRWIWIGLTLPISKLSKILKFHAQMAIWQLFEKWTVFFSMHFKA